MKKIVFIIILALILLNSIDLLNAKENTFKLNIPEKYGRVVESYQGKDNRLIIQIQDLHTNYEAQSQEAKTYTQKNSFCYLWR